MGIQINGTTDTISAVDGSLDINQNATFGNNVTIGGTLTYSDVTNIDSVGLVTAKNGLRIHAGGIDLTSGISTFSDNIQIADKIIHKDDTDTNIRFPSANTFAVETSGDERLRITSAGKVGINTTTPYTALEVQGDGGTNDATITFTRHGSPANGSVIGSNFYRIGTDSVAGIGAYRESAMDDAYLAFHTQATGGNYTERLRITSAGKVGIGSAVPAYNLDISGSGTQQLAVQSTGAADAVIRLNNSVLSWDFDNDGNGTVESGAAGTLHLRNSSLGDAAVMSFTAAGNIGISTSVPSTGQDLTFDGASNYKAGIFYRQAGVSQYRFMCEGGTGHVYYDTFVDGGDHVFRTNAAAGASEKLRITEEGTVQFGTSGVLKVEINNSVSGHKFISQCDDNNNGFEVYQQHGSTATRNTLAVYDNRGNSGAKQLSFAVIGDGNVSVPHGNLVFGNDCGINFAAADDTATGETTDSSMFDDYEEGRWTPYFGTNSQLQLTATYTHQSGSYTKVGNLVFVMFDIIVSNTPSGSAGYPLISGLPYAPLTGQTTQGGFPVPSFRSMSAAPADMRAYGTDSYGHNSHSAIWIAYYNSSGVSQQPAGGTFWTSGRMTGNLTYRTAA